MRDIICIGASAGGLTAISEALAGLDPGLPASIFIVVHIPAFQDSHLGDILNRAGPLPASAAVDGTRFEKGHVYVAPPDHHVLLERGHMSVVKGPKENRFRPAVDPLFRSVAQYYPERAIGVVMSGALDDGTAGLWALKRSGGIAIVQDFGDALYPDMPRNAAAYVDVDHMVTAAAMGPLLNRIVGTRSAARKAPAAVAELTRVENDYARLKDMPRAAIAEIGEPSSLICPTCNGPLWQINEGPRRFRCHTGHSFTPNTLIEEHRELAERMLSVLMTLFDDEVTLSKHVLETTVDQTRTAQTKHNLRESERRAALLRDLLPGGFQQQRTKRDPDP